STADVYSSIYYAGRLATDPLNDLSQGEAILQLGSGSQLSASSRWGDYSMLAVDPTDDCSFWYTTEYIASTDVVPWRTRIGKFKFAECGASVPVTVSIDIRPGRSPNRINPSSDRTLRVAVLTDGSFDASTIDPTTLRFGAKGTEAAPLRVVLRDIDGDGDIDAIIRFAIPDTGIVCGNSSAFLTGKTVSGQAFQGSDSIVTVQCP